MKKHIAFASVAFVSLSIGWGVGLIVTDIFVSEPEKAALIERFSYTVEELQNRNTVMERVLIRHGYGTYDENNQFKLLSPTEMAERRSELIAFGDTLAAGSAMLPKDDLIGDLPKK